MAVQHKTALQLNLVLAGRRACQEQVWRQNKQKFSNFTLCKMLYLSIHGQMPFRRWIDQETRRGENMWGTLSCTRQLTRPRNQFLSQALFMFLSHKVTFPKQGLDRLTECQLSKSLTSLTARPRMKSWSDHKGIQTSHIGLTTKTGHDFRIKGLINCKLLFSYSFLALKFY